MVINKNAGKIWKFSILQFDFFSLKFAWSHDLASTSSPYDSITLSHIILELSVILAKYFQFLQSNVEFTSHSHEH